MNENINLCELLKGHEGETFYSPLFGEGQFEEIDNSIYPIIINANDSNWAFAKDGKFVYSKNAECLLFPSKNQRDWNEWAEEQKPKGPKTWSKFTKIFPPPTKNSYKDYPHIVNYLIGRREDITPIEKSALALIKIYQLIEYGYGGNITNKEWEDNKQEKYVIDYNHDVITGIYYNQRNHISFHTEKQRDEFLSYPENIQLVKEFYMI